MAQSDVKVQPQAVTKNVTNWRGKSSFFSECNQSCNQTEGTPGQRRAIGSTISGHRGQCRAIQGNQTFGLITQRSHVQIMPPQPTLSWPAPFY